MRVERFSAGKVIFREGDESREVYRILSGRIEITIGTGAQTVALATLGPGDIFGEMAMIEDKARSATATAIEPAEAETLTPAEFNHAILQDPARLVPYLASFFERLRTTNNLLRMEVRKGGRRGEGALERLHVDTGAPGAPLRVLPAARVMLEAATDFARKRASAEELRVDKFPFLIGRMMVSGQSDVLVHNDYFIRDEAPFRISRNHCAIDREGEGFYVRDRGSENGTILNGRALGLKHETLSGPLHPGDNELVLGGEKSPFAFTIRVSAGGA